MDIRKEQVADQSAIHQLTEDAFSPMAFSDGTEADVIDRLRNDGDLTLSLVAVNNTEIVGHVAFSPVIIGDAVSGWYGLGPVAVRPDHQRKGIGTHLIETGLDILRTQKAEGCALIGDPGYYSRFGFISDGTVHYENLPDKHVQWISFGLIKPGGELVFRPAFDS